MKVGRKSTALALATGAALVLSACGGDGEAEESSTAPETLGAPASESTAAASSPSTPGPSAGETERFAVDSGGYMFSLPDGSVCSVDGELNERVGSDFACLLTLEEPMQTEDGEPTKGLEYNDTMFIPSAALTDPDLQTEFAGAEVEALDAGSRITVGDYQVVAETTDETLIENDVNGGSYFIALQQPTRFWTPRPDWVPEPNFPPIG